MPAGVPGGDGGQIGSGGETRGPGAGWLGGQFLARTRLNDDRVEPGVDQHGDGLLDGIHAPFCPFLRGPKPHHREGNRPQDDGRGAIRR